MKTLTSLCAILFVVSLAYGQTVVVGQQAIDDSRYDGKEKNPYLFKEFAKATATNSKKGETVEYLINYNGHTKEFEFIHKGVKSEMDARYYDVIEVSDYTPSDYYAAKYVTPTLKFVKGINPKSPKTFGIVVYEDENLTLYKDFFAKISKKEFQDPARGVVTVETFMPNFNYFVKMGDGNKMVGFNKKKLLSALDHAKVESFVKKNKLKIKNETELVQVIQHYSELTAAESSTSGAIAKAGNK